MSVERESVVPATLDDWLRKHLGRRLVVMGMTLPAPLSATEGPLTLDAPLAGVVEALSEFRELWVRWLAAGVTLAAAFEDGRLREADVVLVWCADPAWQDSAPALRGVLARADATGVRDASVMALVGPAVTNDLAHRLGFQLGFAEDTPLSQIAVALACEALAYDEFRQHGSSPPCYL